MKKALILLSLLSLCLSASNGRAEEGKLVAAPARDLSLKLEIGHAIDKALTWFTAQQNPAGHWSQPEYPALTGLVLTGYMGEPSGAVKANPPEAVVKGYQYLLQCVKPDGAIYVKDMANYNTSVAIMALLASYDPSYEPIIRRARNFIVGLQDDFDRPGELDNPLDGGIGYGGTYKHSDMSNTYYALEALHYTKFLSSDAGADATPLKDLNWQAAIRFIERSQNLPESNDQPWASGDPENRGGFVYFPGDSKAGEVETGDGKKALRSYGSISYAGLLSYIYADLRPDDPRVKAVLDWLARHYTLEENPGMGQEGLFYYYHTMAKGLSAAGIDTLTLADGRRVNWRKELAKKLLDLQHADGSWVNPTGRWWEKDPVLVTAYATIIMEILHRGL
ncbi:MAG: prenyltransferase/squalene oxidase repeat-containing protein [Thermodesulfobacteriota bacterium]